MSSPAVNTQTLDLSTRVPSFPGVFGGIVMPAKKGNTERATLVTSETQFLSRFTPNEKVNIGFDNSYYSALAYLQKSDKLWVARAVNGAYYAGASFKTASSTTENQPLPSDQQLEDPSSYVFDSNPDVAEAKEKTLIKAVADNVTPAVNEETSIETVADNSGSLDGLYFFLYDVNGSVAFWIDVDDSGTVEPAHGADRSVEITTIATNDAADTVATKIAAVIDGDSKFSASASVNVISVVHEDAGDLPDATAETSGFTVTVSTQGEDAISSLDGKYFIMYDAAGSVGFWIDIDDSGTTAPAGATSQDRAVEITTINQGDDANTVATKLAAAIDADAAFSATAADNEVTVEDADFGERDDATDGNTGFTFTVLVQGATEVDLQDELFLLYAANEGAWGNDLSIKIVNFSEDEDNILDNETFRIEIYKGSNLAEPVEEFQVSRIQDKQDGFGRNIYIEDRLQASEYIRAIDNDAVDEAIVPKSQTSSAVAMGGGDDGSAVTDSDMQSAADQLSNPDNILLTVLMDGGRATAAYQTYLDTIAQNRNDCVAILSVPFSAEDSSDYINDISEYRKDTLNLNSSHSAIYTPHVEISDKFNDRNIFVSPDGYAAGAISETASNFEIWFPPAGYKRGTLNVLDLRRRYTKGERDTLYNIGINPIKFKPGKGIAIWGQKTLQSTPSSLDRLNVRLLLITIQPAIAEFLEDFVFEFNDAGTRAQVRGKLTTYMDGIQGRRGVSAYVIVCDASNNTADVIDANRMNVDLYIRPTKSAEFIRFRTIIVSEGDSFDSAQQAA